MVPTVVRFSDVKIARLIDYNEGHRRNQSRQWIFMHPHLLNLIASAESHL